ncbi:probable disease resistance protein At4g27220 [Mangifera indica]|uniref:probable disease resistance protein At4g27220 n=1 Tax=Mangifera indica TaxID=29780 RepID=UPI001CF9DFCA|nr:probable disease resistance protein At4g27220 [Mangifera indica]
MGLSVFAEDEVGERKLLGPELVQITSNKIKLIRERLRTAQSRQKSYADHRRQELEFEVGDFVFLKVSPWKGVFRFGKRGKLSPRFIGSFEILEKIGAVAYRVALPPSLSRLHNVFHVSALRKYLAYPSHVLDYQPIQISEDLSYEEQALEVIDRKKQFLRNRVIPLVKVHWRNHSLEEATWEQEAEIKEKYPQLFDALGYWTRDVTLTSRRKNVCDQIGCDKTFTIGTLTKQESWVLFKELVRMDAENSIISSIAREITTECDGMSITIMTVARALKNRDMYEWRDALQFSSLELSNFILEGMHENVISSLELSYNFLESVAKSVFLFCSIFPEDFVIPVEVLVRYGAGLRWFKDLGTIEDIRVRSHAIESNLISSFLLIGEEYDKKCVKMHDVVCDVAHIIAPKHNYTFLVKAGTSLKEWPKRDTFEDLLCISLMLDDIKEVLDAIECLMLQSLLLQRNSKLVVPNNFFQGIKNLRVLDLSETQLSSLPMSLSFLVNLRTLYLNGCKLGDLSIIGDLSKLEILSLYGSNVREIPISFSRLTHMRLLNLNNCKELT